MKHQFSRLIAGFSLAVLVTGSAWATQTGDCSSLGGGTLQCQTPVPTVLRTWQLGSSTAAGMHNGNAGVSADITGSAELYGSPSAFDGADWTKRGDISPASGSGSFFNGLFLGIDVTSGAFGSSGVGGTWSLTPAFWTTYGEAVVTMHVGEATGAVPDAYDTAIFLLTAGTTSGTFSYANTGAGGGFSNFMVWSRGTGNAGCVVVNPGDCGSDVPLPGTLALLGAGVFGLGWRARRTVKAN